MRRVPKPLPDEEEFWRFRVLGAIIPELDDLVAAKPASLPTSGTPILPLYLRPALLAGVATIDRAGPGMLPTTILTIKCLPDRNPRILTINCQPTQADGSDRSWSNGHPFHIA